MITFEEFKAELTPAPFEPYDYEAQYKAFVSMSKAFRVEDAPSFKEAKRIILIGMDAISSGLDQGMGHAAFTSVMDPEELRRDS